MRFESRLFLPPKAGEETKRLLFESSTAIEKGAFVCRN